jgi:hypothetical protein
VENARTLAREWLERRAQAAPRGGRAPHQP